MIFHDINKCRERFETVPYKKYPVDFGERMNKRKPNRLKGHDYSTPGAYFITVCAHDQFENRNIFGTIHDGKMIKNRYADLITSSWYDLPNHYHHIALDEFVVMPDHFHSIVWINKTVGNGLEPFQKHGLPEIIRGFKTFSARHINEINHDDKFQWQKSYYDHVIRSEKSLLMIREYIRNNPEKWELDHDQSEGNDISQMLINGGVRNGLKPFPTKNIRITGH